MSSITEEQELNEILSKSSNSERSHNGKTGTIEACEPKACDETESSNNRLRRNLVQWTTSDSKIFIPATRSVGKLTPGLYEINQSNRCGIYFERIGLGTEGIVRFKETNSDEVVQEIEMFWERESLFGKFNLAFKRGILLWGPPGSGKTCTIKMVIEDLIKRSGIVVKFGHPGVFMEGMRMFREIEPSTPCVVLMEDLDSIIAHYSESDVINILDGVDMITKVVFLATTNYPERLGARIVNRPSRFDKRIKIGKPNAESRKTYFEHLFSANGKSLRAKYNIDEWVKDMVN